MKSLKNFNVDNFWHAEYIFFKLRMFPGIKVFIRKIIFVFSELFYINAMHN